MADILTWTQQLSTHVDEMDEEHKKLIALMNHLYEINNKRVPKIEIKKALAALGAYAQEHFSDEEQYMERINYNQLTTHKILHKQLIDQFVEHSKKFDESGDVLPDAFFQFLKFWLTTHISHIDVKYGA